MTDQSVNVYIRAIDQFSATAAKVGGSLGALEARASGLTGALGHAKGQISGLVGSLGVLGGFAALGGVSALLGTSVAKAKDFGAEVIRLQALTGGTAESMSALSAAFDHFGITQEAAQRSVGFLEKNLGLLSVQKDGIVKFEKEFGLSVTLTNGKLADANTLLLRSADFFNNKLIPATTKAAALSKLFGRSWQELIPFLQAGSAGIAAAEEEAQKLGLTLSGSNLNDLIKLRDATRTWSDALGGLQLQIGLALVPALTDLTKAATTFVANNRDGIVNGFRAAANFAGQLADAINKYVIPAIGAIAGAWNSIPKEFRDFLIGGFVAQKASSWLFGSGPLDWIKSAIGLGARKSGIGAALGGIGVQHVWVDNPGFGGGGVPGVAGAAGEAAGGSLVASIAASAAGLVAILGAPLVASYFAQHGMFGFSVNPSIPNRMGPAGGSQWSHVSGQAGAPLNLSGLLNMIPGAAALQGVIGTGVTDLNAWKAAQISHTGARNAFSQKTFRSSAAGAISEFPDLVRYLAGAQGAYGGKGSAGFLSGVSGEIGILQRLMKTATPAQQDKIATEIKVLQAILRNKRFDPSPALLDALKAGPSTFPGKAADDKILPMNASTKTGQDATNNLLLAILAKVGVTVRDINTATSTHRSYGPTGGSLSRNASFGIS